MKFISQILKLANNKVTVMLSMGIDSIAVAHFIKTKYPKIELNCWHYNHNLRQQNILMREMFLKFCKDFNIKEEYNSRDLFQEDNSEASLRKDRYKALAYNKFRYPTIICCQHLDDAVESHFMNFCNGVEEYLPIPLITKHEYEKSEMVVIRPFILNTKEEFRKYIIDNNLSKYVVEDETNIDEKYRRNWVRNNILPQIKDKGINIETIVRKKYNKWIEENL